MLSAIRNRFTYANVAATLALVFAMTGGAYAANRFLISSTKQISPKVLKSLKGAKGANGANGAAGPAGPAGLQGPGGAAGVKGETGPAGAAGAKGEAGVKGEKGEKGEKGLTGERGETGFTETLPSGKTETGTWVAYNYGLIIEGAPVKAAISFPIPVPATSSEAFVLNEEETVSTEPHKGGCASNGLEPSAPKGELCVYTIAERLEKVSAPLVEDLTGAGGKYSPAGAVLHFEVGSEVSPAEPGLIKDEGTWAVTAP